MSKYLLISQGDLSGGAARACYRLHSRFMARNLESFLKVRRRLSDDWSVWGPESSFQKINTVFRERVGSRIVRLQRSRGFVTRSTNIVPSRWSAEINAGTSDVVNLHWVGGETMAVRDIGRIRKPVVLTLHDMWAFCGAEHYAPDGLDARWRQGYLQSNRELGDRGFDIDRFTWRRKRHHWRPMTVVCPSRWLADCARASALMAGWPIHVVPNVLDTDVFKPINKSCARRILNLPEDCKVVLFGALGGSRDPRKGYDLLLDALNALADNSSNWYGVVFGERCPQHSPISGLPMQWLGHVHDDYTLAILYSAVDVMVVPSRQENLPQTATEAQSCGTPVVGFNAGGMSDAVVHGETGYLAEPFSSDDLADGIKWVLTDDARYASLCAAARRRAVRLWSPEVILPKYIDVYRQAIEFHQSKQ